MSGVVAVRALLLGSDAVLAKVPASRIKAGDLPHGTKLPAIGLQSISTVYRNIASPGAVRHVIERVQVMVYAPTYLDLDPLSALVREACADRFPGIAGIGQVVVLLDGRGPDFADETASIHMRPQDFRVSYNETR